MKSCIGFVRWILSTIVCVFLLTTFVIGIPFASFSKLVANPDNVKKWIEEGKVYDNVIDIVVETLVDNKNKQEQELPKVITEQDPDTLKSSAKKILPKEWVQTQSENALEAIFLWLDGKSEIPEFEIDVASRKDALINETYSLYQSYIKDLPECSDSETQAILESTTNYDPLNATCVPPAYNVYGEDEVKEKMREELDKSEIFKEDTVSSGEFFKVDSQITKNAQKIYSVVKNLYRIITVVILVLSVILFILVPRLFRSFLVTGSVWVLGSLGLLAEFTILRGRLDSLFLSRISSVSTEQLERSKSLISPIIEIIIATISSDIRQYTFIWLVLGVILVIGGIILRFSKRRYYVREDEERFTHEDAIGSEKKISEIPSIPPSGDVSTSKDATTKQSTSSIPSSGKIPQQPT